MRCYKLSFWSRTILKIDTYLKTSMQTVEIFSNTNTNIRKLCTAITSISVFLSIKEVFHFGVFLKNDAIFENDVILTS